MIILIMGVSGSGKSTLGRALAKSLGWDLFEGDDYHPRPNIEKMRAGIPLTEHDRGPWLERLHDLMASIAGKGGNAVVTCSALKMTYRGLLSQGLPDLRFAFLCGDPQLIRERLQDRQHAFMPSGLLDSQLAALEPPVDAVVVPVRHSIDEQVELIRRKTGIAEHS